MTNGWYYSITLW